VGSHFNRHSFWSKTQIVPFINTSTSRTTRMHRPPWNRVGALSLADQRLRRFVLDLISPGSDAGKRLRGRGVLFRGTQEHGETRRDGNDR